MARVLNQLQCKASWHVGSVCFVSPRKLKEACRLPMDIPADYAVPAWAYLSVVNEDKFNSAFARSIAGKLPNVKPPRTPTVAFTVATSSTYSECRPGGSSSADEDYGARKAGAIAVPGKGNDRKACQGSRRVRSSPEQLGLW
ncbi:hypothetical protein NMY22_g7099 [Coprinellus aureogranulatus]|nr:hypothetical protein NMY22_g7099 [Coprinellus aureogranulatus]